MITERDHSVLEHVCRYYVLSRPQIQRLCFPSDTTGRVTRRRLQALVSAQLLNRHRAEVQYPSSAPAGSVYYPSVRGRELLFETTGDERYLLTPVQCPQSHHLLHWLAVSDTHIALDQAVAGQELVTLLRFVNEWDVVNHDETEPAKRYTLFTTLQDNPRLVCVPDAAFVLAVAGVSKVFYLEQDRGTTGVKQVAARKCKGYSELHSRRLFRTQFPEATVDTFSVLCIAPTVGRREALRRSFVGKPGEELWRFAVASDLTPEAFLFEPVLYPVKGDAMPLVKRPAPSRSDATDDDPQRRIVEKPPIDSQLTVTDNA